MFGPSARLLSRFDPPFGERNERVFDHSHRPIRPTLRVYIPFFLSSIHRFDRSTQGGQRSENLEMETRRVFNGATTERSRLYAVGENEGAEYRWHARGQRSRFCILEGMRTCSCIRSESGATDGPPTALHGSRHFSPILFSRPFHSSPIFSHLTRVFYITIANFYTVTRNFPFSRAPYVFYSTPRPRIFYFPSRIDRDRPSSKF